MTRSRFQGLRNIIVFNWPYYAVAVVLVAGLWLSSALAPSPWSGFLLTATVLVALPTLTSILASIWIYDLSGLYGLRWLEDENPPRIKAVLVLNAGFTPTPICSSSNIFEISPTSLPTAWASATSTRDESGSGPLPAPG